MTQYSNTNIQNPPVPCAEKQAAKKYFTAWLILFLTPIILFVLGGITHFILGLFSDGDINLNNTSRDFLSVTTAIAGHIVIIVGKIKLHNEKSINIAFWIDIISLILSILAIITSTVFLIVGFFKFGDAFPELINESIQTFSDFLHNFS